MQRLTLPGRYPIIHLRFPTLEMEKLLEEKNGCNNSGEQAKGCVKAYLPVLSFVTTTVGDMEPYLSSFIRHSFSQGLTSTRLILIRLISVSLHLIRCFLLFTRVPAVFPTPWSTSLMQECAHTQKQTYISIKAQQHDECWLPFNLITDAV